MKGRKGVMKRKRCKNWCRRGIIFLLLLGAKIAPTIYRSSRLPHQGESLSGVPWQFKADPKPCPCGTGHGLNHTITRSRNRQWSKIAPSAAVLDHRVMFLASAHKETSLRSSSTTERARVPHFNEATCGFRSPALAGRIDSTSRVPRRKDPTGTVRCRSTKPKEKNKKVSLTPNQSAFSG